MVFSVLQLQYKILLCNTPMRNIMTISLPLPLSTVVEKEVKRGNYASKSEFFRYLLRQWIEGRLSHELQESRKEIQQGKGKLLKSLSDLR